jgi:hypothetical protein
VEAGFSLPGEKFPPNDDPTLFAIIQTQPETDRMRIVYLTLGLFILLNIGAACRTEAPEAAGCERVAAGLVHCKDDGGGRRE